MTGDRDPIAAVKALLPWVGDDEAFVRSRLLLAQQISASRAVRSESEDGRTIWWMVNRHAASSATAPATMGELTDLRAALVRLTLVAGYFERAGRVEEEPQQ